MGLTPLEGLVMGTRSGDVDAGIVGYLATSAGMTAHEIDELLNKRSGLLGLAGVNDFRSLAGPSCGGRRPRRVGLPGLRAPDRQVRRRLPRRPREGRHPQLSPPASGRTTRVFVRTSPNALHPLGFVLDPERNATGTGTRRISTDDSPTTMLVVPTNEELAIARATAATLVDWPGSVPA